MTSGSRTVLTKTLTSLGEGLALVGMICCIPFVILAIGLPIVLFVRLLLWVGGVL